MKEYRWEYVIGFYMFFLNEEEDEVNVVVIEKIDDCGRILRVVDVFVG